MKRKLIETGDGSHTLEVEGLDETYHSRHGARQESQHVFIEAGLEPAIERHAVIRIFEVGFGTGLNALLTFEALKGTTAIVEYTGLEAFPLEPSEFHQLNYAESPALRDIFIAMHASPWEEAVRIAPQFTLVKRKSSLQDMEVVPESADLIYYDAFGPRAQPEMWTPEIFRKLFELLAPEGVLVTYCAKGQVRRDLMAAGFGVERLPGPKGKRHMMRARKP